MNIFILNGIAKHGDNKIIHSIRFKNPFVSFIIGQRKTSVIKNVHGLSVSLNSNQNAHLPSIKLKENATVF